MQEGTTDDETFMAMYNHKTNPEDDERYVKIKFGKFSEQAWDDKGKQIEGKKVLSKKGTIKFSKEILENWNKLN